VNAAEKARREMEIFEQVLDVADAGERLAFLKSACGENAALLARVQALLQAHEAPEGFLPHKRADQTILVPGSEKPGDWIGRYKLCEKVGEGGCGVVYVAEQEKPIRRKVALKVIKLGMDTRNVVARFEAERQALAMMDYPNIAKVLEAGATETGRPYFVMELVRGIKITDYCDQHQLSTRERLELFIKVCQAVQHAHQKGIIHRDLKPSNILVAVNDGVAVPKVIDFGIAKATEGRLTDLTVYTDLHQFIGTPAYMSPEQATMTSLDIDTRSDIYSLGVLLYELLTGRTPFDAKDLISQGIDAMRKTIREKDPVQPSTRLRTLQGEELTTTARCRGVDPPKLVGQLRGDLDWIVMKCLEKDRTRRYETVNGLAMDLRRHLDNETVLARPPSKLYEFQRMVRRHKVGFLATAAIIGVLAAGVALTSWQAVRATHAQQEAVAQRQHSEANEKKAIAAQMAEAKEELSARQRAYASDMNVAMQAFHENNLGRALDLLNRVRPQAGQTDLRGWEWRYLWRRTRSDALFTLCQMSSQIDSLAASSDGDFLAVGTFHKGGVAVWDLRTRQEVARLAKNDWFVQSAFSPVAPLLAFTGSPSNTLHLWNAATRQMAVEIPLGQKWCYGLAFSSDGKTLATLGEQIVLWRVSDGIKLASFPSPGDINFDATEFAVTRDFSLAAFPSGPPNPQRVRVMDLRNGKELWTAVASPEHVLALAFSPDGTTLASAAGYVEGDIGLWDAATGAKIGSLLGHTAWVGSLVFWPDGKKLASASADQTIRIWDVGSRECLDVMRGHRSEVWRLALLPDHKTLVSGGKDGTVCLWDASVAHARQENIILPVRVRGWTLAHGWGFAPNSRSILAMDTNGEVARWTGGDFQEKEPLWTNINSTTCCFSQDGRLAAIGSSNGIVSVWDLSRRIPLWRLTNGTGFAEAIGFSANGTKLVTLARPLCHAWDLATALETQSWQVPTFPLYSVALSPDAQWFVGLGWEGEVFGRNLAEAKNVALPLAFLEPWDSAFSPDGKLFSVASLSGYAHVWEVKGWKEVTMLGRFRLGAHSVVFSVGGKRVAIGAGGAEALKLWDTESWQDVCTLQGSRLLFETLSFSPDENIIGAATRAGILNVWRAPSWEEIRTAEAKEKMGTAPP
jgi:serine/threonine protein kinase/WD40 repeat protein